ncbi:MAG: hypothetical protein P8X47_10775 [Ignavibacteriaceae bacterium]|jgi:hypothetical protein
MFSLKSYYSIPIFVLVISILLIIPAEVTNAQTVIRIGVFDSRAVAVAYYNSDFSNTKEIFQSIATQMQEAKSKDDKQAIAKIEREATLRQAMLHEQGFGTGSVINITETVKDKLTQLANDENLSAIVSKWEISFNNNNVALIDITEKIVHFFDPNDQMKDMVKEIMQTEVVKDAYLIED